MLNRTGAAIKNSLFSVITYLISTITIIIARTVFIKVLGIEILGLNGLFTSILFILSFTELGIGSAMTFALYKPVHERDLITIKSIMNLFSRTYRFIALFTVVIGLLIIPFLQLFIDVNSDIPIRLYFILFLFNSAVSYIFSEYKSLLIVMQMNYVESIVKLFLITLMSMMQIIALIFFENYLLYLLIQLLITCITNYIIRLYTKKKFQYIFSADDVELDRTIIDNIIKNTKGMISHRIGSIVVTGTDNILISTFIGISTVGIFSNYNLIVNVLKSILTQLVNPIVGSVGNFNITETGEASFKMYRRISFIFFYFVVLFTSGISICINDVIKAWIGDSYLLSSNIVLLITINFYVILMRKPTILYIDSLGYFWELRLKSIVEAVLNLVISLTLLQFFKMGLYGVLLGTLLSNILTNLWWEPKVLFEKKFNKKLTDYFKLYTHYSLITLLISVIAYISANKIEIEHIFINLVLKIIITVLVVTFLFIVLFRKSEEYFYTKTIFLQQLHRISKKTKNDRR
jgi:O-antigen/teichoic acid export membrane protein